MLAGLLGLRTVRVLLLVAITWGPLLASAGLVSYYNEQTVRDRYVRIMNSKMGLPGDIARIENLDLRHRNLHGLMVFRPDTQELALDAEVIEVEELDDGGRYYTVRNARAEFGDVFWMKAIRWPSSANHPMLMLTVENCDLAVEQRLVEGRRLRLAFGGVNGQMDFRAAPAIRTEFAATHLNGYRCPEPITVRARMTAARPELDEGFALHEGRISLGRGVPLRALLGELLGPTGGPWDAALVTGDVLLRMPAGQTQIQLGLENLKIRLPDAELSVERAELSRTAVSVGRFRLSLPVPAGWPSELHGSGLTLEPKPALGGWDGELKLTRLGAAELPLTLAFRIPFELLPTPGGEDRRRPELVSADGPAQPPAKPPNPAQPGAAPVVPARSARAVIATAAPLAIARLSGLLPSVAALKSGHVIARLELGRGPEGLETELSLAARELSLTELGLSRPGQLSVELQGVQSVNLRPQSGRLVVASQWSPAEGQTASVTATSVGRVRYPDAGGAVLDWTAEDVSIKLPQWKSSLDLAGQLRTAADARAGLDAELRLSRIGTLGLGNPVKLLGRLRLWDDRGGLAPTLEFSAAAMGLPMADVASQFGYRVPVGALDAKCVGGRFELSGGGASIGRVAAGELQVDARLGTMAKPRGKLTAATKGGWPPSAFSARLEEVDLSALSELPGVPPMAGRASAALSDGRLTSEGRLRDVKLSVKGRLDDLSSVTKSLKLEPAVGGELKLDKLEATIRDGRFTEVATAGQLIGVDLSHLTTLAGYGSVSGRVDLLLGETTAADGKVKTLSLEVAETTNYDGPRTVSKEALGVMVQQLGLSSRLATGSLEYDSLGAKLTLREGNYVLEGTGTTSTQVIGRLHVVFPVPVYLPEKSRVRAQTDYAGWEETGWQTLMDLPKLLGLEDWFAAPAKPEKH